MPLLEVEHLVKRYGSVEAVNDVSFTVARGEVVGLLGPNGAGKSTTIHCILGLLTPTSGCIRLFGRSVERERSAVAHRVNFASAYASLPHNLTVRETLVVFADYYGVRSPPIPALLEELELTPFANRQIGQLSAGQRMRALLAKALVSAPELLVLDEPTASLDPETALRIREVLAARAAAGTTILWTSHNLREVEEYCHRVLILRQGRIVVEGTPQALAQRAGQITVRVRFAHPPADWPGVREPLNGQAADLRAGRSRIHPPLGIDEGDGWYTVAAADEAEAAELVARAHAQGQVLGLELRPPTLEDLFLQISRAA